MARPIEPADVWRICDVADVRISPDGERVAFTVRRPDHDRDRDAGEVWVADVDGGDARAFSTRRAGGARWSPDGRALAYVARTDDGAQVHLARLDGGEPTVLTDGERTPRALAWSPDGTQLAFVRDVADPAPESAIEKHRPRIQTGLRDRIDGLGPVSDRRSHVFVVDVGTGATRQVTAGDWDDDAPAWSPDGSTIVFTSNRHRHRHDQFGRTDLHTVPAAGGRSRKLTAGDGNFTVPVFSPSGDTIAAVGTVAGGDRWLDDNRVLLVDATSGAVTEVGAANDRPAMAVDGQSLAWLDDDTILSLFADRGGVALACVSTDPDEVPRPVLDGDRAVRSFDVHGDQLVWVESWIDRFPEVWAASLPSSGRVRSPSPVSTVNADISSEVELRSAVRRTHTAPDGLEVESFVLEGRGRGRRPGVVDIHGGPFGAHPPTDRQWALRLQCLAAAGYTVVLPNPRGSVGYGEAFKLEVVEDMGGADYHDVLGALDAAIEGGDVHPDEVHVTGYSYGGYLSSWAIGQTDRFGSAVVGAPVTDWASILGSGDIPEYCVVMHGGSPTDLPELYRERSPVTWAHRATTPTLIHCQETDLRTPINQSEQLFSALRLGGCEAVLVRYPGGSHLGATPSQWEDRIERTIGWFRDHGS